MKKFLVLLLSLMMLCSAAFAEGAASLKMSDEKVTFTVLQELYANQNVDAETNWAINWLEEQTNVELVYEFVKSPDWDTKFNLVMASGELPDIVWAAEGLDDEEYGVIQQIFIPVDELIDQYMPNLKALIEGEPTSLAACYASDGHIYGLPVYYDNAGPDAQGFQFINQNWLDKLGLATPTTVEELTDVLRAFKTQDPNGNGVADEIPYIATFDDHISSGLWTSFFFFGIPTDGTTFFSLDEEGVVTFDPYRPGFRACVEWLHTLYEEGLMDKESLTQDTATLLSKLNDGLVGYMSFWRMNNMNIDGVKDNYAMLTPVPAEGYQALRHKYAPFAFPRIYLTNPDTAEFIARYIDAQLPIDVQFTMDYGEKGVDWDINADGKYYYIHTNAEAPNKAKANFSVKFRTPELYEIIEMPIANVERLGYSNIHNEAGVVQKYSNDLMKCAAINAEDSARLALALVDIQTAVKEFVSQGIVNGVTDASWDTFMANCQKMGVQDYVDTYNAGMVNVIQK